MGKLLLKHLVGIKQQSVENSIKNNQYFKEDAFSEP